MTPPGNAPGLEVPDSPAVYGVESVNFREAGLANDAPPPAAVPGPAECMPSPWNDPLFRADATAWPEAFGQSRYGTAAAQETGKLQSPVELYQAQYQVGLLLAHVNVMVHSSQSLTQSMETALKQSG
jgi:hypothetical protein